MKMHHFSSKRKQTLRYRWTRVNGSSLIYAMCILKVVGMFEQIFSIFDVTMYLPCYRNYLEDWFIPVMSP